MYKYTEYIHIICIIIGNTLSAQNHALDRHWSSTRHHTVPTSYSTDHNITQSTLKPFSSYIHMKYVYTHISNNHLEQVLYPLTVAGREIYYL